MYTKSGSVTYFHYFKAMAENLFRATIKYFQIDGALDLTKGNFKKVLDEYGIVSRVSCPHTPEQNGVAERKHRHK